MKPDGLVLRQSAHGPKETADRLAASATAHGMTVFARIDHAGLAAEAGMSLRATEVLIIGNPKGGTPLMQAVQSIGIDLPLKALVFADESGKTFVAYNDPHWLAARHGVTGQGNLLAVLTNALETVTKDAAS